MRIFLERLKNCRSAQGILLRTLVGLQRLGRPYFKNNTEVTNSKCYTFASSVLLCLFFTLNFKMMINIWPHLKVFGFPPDVLGWLRPW